MEVDITVGPFGIFFTNVNTAMNLDAHSHYATVELTFASLPGPKGVIGFPSFRDTAHEIEDYLKEVTQKPFENSTNEAIGFRLFALMKRFAYNKAENYPESRFELKKLSLNVMGVHDRIGHSSGFTRYEIKD